MARAFAAKLSPGTTVALFGDLGAGKTTFVKGMVAELCEIDSREVSSPTFNYLNIYLGPHPVYHFDLYRLRSSEEFLAMGFEEQLSADGICCIEWAERISSILPEDVVRIYISHAESGTRKIEINP